jgi:hypothetical protein
MRRLTNGKCPKEHCDTWAWKKAGKKTYLKCGYIQQLSCKNAHITLLLSISGVVKINSVTSLD